MRIIFFPIRHRFEDQHECGYNPAANDRPNRYEKLAQNSGGVVGGGIQSTIKNFFGFNNGGGTNNNGSKQPPPQNTAQTQQEVNFLCK